MAPTDPQEFRKHFGRRAAELRQNLGLTQEQFAERMRMTTNYIARIEGGWENLTLDSVARLAAGLGVKAWKLFLKPRSTSVRRGRPPQKKAGH